MENKESSEKQPPLEASSGIGFAQPIPDYFSLPELPELPETKVIFYYC